MATGTATAESTPRQSAVWRKRRVLSSSFFGTAVEWYDFYAYGTATALIFNTQFFPTDNAALGSIAAFAIFAIGFISRPLGGAVAGHLGDRFGRKALLSAALIVMGLASVGIGLLPGYATIGPFAVIGLIVLRLVQGLASGAEWGGSAALAVEHAPRGRRGFFGSFTQTGSAAGLLLASGSFALAQAVFTHEQFISFGWRLPFLASAVLVGIGVYIRFGIEDAPGFRDLKEHGRLAAAPVLEVLRHHRRALLVTIGLRLAQPALFAILAVYLVDYLGQRRGGGEAAVLGIAIVSALGLASGPLWGWASDRVGRKPIAIIGIIAIGVIIWPLFWFFDAGPLILLPLVLFVGMNIVHDSIYGPQAAWFAEQFPTRVRYTGVSLGCQVGTVLSGGLTPVIAASLLVVGGGSPWLICLYIGALSLLSLIAAIAAKDPAGAFARDPAARDTFEEEEQ